MAGATRGFLAAALLALAALHASAQEPTKPLEFEAVSIKPFVPYRPPGSSGATYAGGPCKPVDAGRLACRGTSIQGLVMAAYGVKSFRVFGPDWLDSERFEIEATLPHGASLPQVGPMLQKLLADRFHAKVHRETREMQGYALVVAKGGPKLQEFKASDESPQAQGGDPASVPTEDERRQSLAEMSAAFQAGGKPAGFLQTSQTRSGQSTLTAFGFPVRGLADLLSTEVECDVVDETGLKGSYEIHLVYGSQRSNTFRIGPDGARTPIEPDPAAPSIFSALQSQLGLKLESRKIPMETIVVDSCDRTPTAN